MKRYLAKVLGVMLSVSMVLSVFPAAVSADEALEGADKGESIEIGSNGKPTKSSGNGWIYNSKYNYVSLMDDGYLYTFTKNACQVPVAVQGGTLVGGTFSADVNTIPLTDVNNKIISRGTISGGTFNGNVTNEEEIKGGTFNGKVNNTESTYNSSVEKGTISNGTFNGSVDNFGTVSGGTFKSKFTNIGKVTGGTFNGETRNAVSADNEDLSKANMSYGTISGGDFTGPVENALFNKVSARIDGGRFSGSIKNYASFGSITSGAQMKVTNKLSNVTTSASEWAPYGMDFTESFTPADGYKVSNAVTVSVNGSALSSGKYSFDESSSALTVSASSVTGPITVSAHGYLTSDKVDRLAGKARYDTMLEIIQKENYPTGGTVYVASGANFPDALALSGLCGTKDCPLVLTDPKTFKDQTKNALTLLAPSKIVVVGGTGAVSDTVKNAIAAAFPKADVSERISGTNRIATALKIYEEGSGWSEQAIIADSSNFPDSLSIASYAYAAKCPIFLVNKKTGPDEATMKDLKNFKSVIILGSESAVTADTETMIKNAGLKVLRIFGSNRYATSAAIADWVSGATSDAIQPVTTLGYKVTCVATGENGKFPDALTGSCLAGKNGGVMLLASDKRMDTITGNLTKNGTSVEQLHILGSANSVSDNINDAAVNAIK